MLVHWCLLALCIASVPPARNPAAALVRMQPFLTSLSLPPLVRHAQVVEKTARHGDGGATAQPQAQVRTLLLLLLRPPRQPRAPLGRAPLAVHVWPAPPPPSPTRCCQLLSCCVQGARPKVAVAAAPRPQSGACKPKAGGAPSVRKVSACA